MAALSEAYTIAAGLLNDPSKTEWTDAVMLPRAKKAHVEMQVRLLEYGIPVIKEVSADLSVTAGATTLASPPADLIEPIFMREKFTGEADTLYIDMEEVNFLPSLTSSTRLRLWCWREEKVNFLASTVNCAVQLRYMKGLTTVTSGTSPIGVMLGEAFLGPRIASLCYQSVGQLEDAVINNEDAERQLDRILRASARGMSHKPMRRIPFSVSQAGRRRNIW
jgi:hypothetical protein